MTMISRFDAWRELAFIVCPTEGVARAVVDVALGGLGHAFRPPEIPSVVAREVERHCAAIALRERLEAAPFWSSSSTASARPR